MQYVKKPVVIEALRWTGGNLKEIINLIGLHESALKWTWEEYEDVVQREGLKIFTLEGTMMAGIGDFIIKGVNGEFYPCKPDIFDKTYSQYQPKRNPLPDGTLPLTEKELKEFNKLFLDNSIKLKTVLLENNCLTIEYTRRYKGDWMFKTSIANIKAIQWLAGRFNLEEV